MNKKDITDSKDKPKSNFLCADFFFNRKIIWGKTIVVVFFQKVFGENFCHRNVLCVSTVIFYDIKNRTIF